MKKLSLLFIFLLIFPFYFSCNSVSFAQENEVSFWAKVQQENCHFYVQPSNESKLFVLPNSYFVKLIGETDGFYHAQYKDIVGYVKKDEVSAMDGTPLTPYFVEKFRAFLPSGTGLYAISCMKDEYKIVDIPYLYEELVYYGSIEGEQSIPEKSNLWHYCRYQDQCGFVYSIFCDKLISPPINNETFELIENPSFEKNTTISALSPTAMSFIIIGVSLPCLIVLYLLIKPNMMKATLPKEKNKYKAKRRKDYFEFDQSDLG